VDGHEREGDDDGAVDFDSSRRSRLYRSSRRFSLNHSLFLVLVAFRLHLLARFPLIFLFSGDLLYLVAHGRVATVTISPNSHSKARVSFCVSLYRRMPGEITS
jgi:hypothetical protein